MLHVQRFSGKMHEGLNSGCIQVGNLDAQGQLWEGELLFGVFLSVLLEFAPHTGQDGCYQKVYKQ